MKKQWRKLLVVAMVALLITGCSVIKDKDKEPEVKVTPVSGKYVAEESTPDIKDDFTLTFTKEDKSEEYVYNQEDDFYVIVDQEDAPKEHVPVKEMIGEKPTFKLDDSKEVLELTVGEEVVKYELNKQ